MSSEPEHKFRPSREILLRRALSRRRLSIQRRRLAALTFGVALFVLAVIGLVSVISGGGGGSHAKASAVAVRVPKSLPQVRKPAPDENAVIDHVLSYTSFVSRGGTRGREVALTFDDGPGPYTHRVVATLRRFHAPATFFQVGVMIPIFEGPGRDVRRFFPVGDHTVSHPMLGRLARSEQFQQIAGDIGRLALENAPLPRLFRPPYASFNKNTLAVLRQLRMLMVLWSVDSRDFTRPGAKAIIHNVLSAVKPGAIVLMHDAGGDRSQTIAALPKIIRKLRKRHFKLVTVPQMMHDAPPPRNQKLPPSGEGSIGR